MSERVPNQIIDNPCQQLSWHICRNCGSLDSLAIQGNGCSGNTSPLSVRACLKCGNHVRWLYDPKADEWELIRAA